MRKRRRRDRRHAQRLSARKILSPGRAEDRVGVHLMEVYSYVVAERWFRRAVSLNPAEPLFQVHLAHSLYHQYRYGEAVAVLQAVLATVPGFPPAAQLLGWCTARLDESTIR
jgi:predicted Zn-dependent protease